MTTPQHGVIGGSQRNPSVATNILTHLRTGSSITPLEALKLFNCLSLAQRIYDLREDGYDICTKMIKVGKSKRVAEYRLKPSYPCCKTCLCFPQANEVQA